MANNLIWDDVTKAWGDASAIFSSSKPVQIIGNNFYLVDAGVNWDHLTVPGGEGEPDVVTPVSVVLSRQGLTIFGRDQKGQPKEDPGVIKSVQGIWPEIAGTIGTIVNVSVGFQNVLNEAVRWQGPRSFVVGIDFFLDFIVTGRYLAVRFESSGQQPWTLTGYDLDIERSGER